MLAVHETERPFACPHCDVAYGYKKLLVKHMERMHNSLPAEEEMIPETIDPRLTDEFSLQNLVGLDYVEGREIECPVEGCGRRFGRTYDLDRHLQAVHSILEYIE